MKKPSRWEWINIGVQLAVDLVLLKLIGWTGVGYLALSTFLGYGFHPVAAHFLHEHYVWKEGQETYSYYGPLNWVNFNVGYHNEHHDLMGIPGWKLPQVKKTAPEFYDGLVTHRSWALLQWHFVLNPQMGHDSRVSRTSLGRGGMARIPAEATA